MQKICARHIGNSNLVQLLVRLYYLDFKQTHFIITKAILFPNGCQYNTSYYEFMPLKTISSERLSPPSPIDRGAIQAMGSEDSIAYRHMCPTNVPSYAIAGSWIPGAFNGHTLMERFYRNLLNNPTANLDIDGFGGNFIGN